MDARHKRPHRYKDRAGFYGLDLYNMRGSIAAVLDYLDKVDPQQRKSRASAMAVSRLGSKEPSSYGRAVLTGGYRKCEQVVVEQCRDLLETRLEYAAQDEEGFLDAAQNARLIASAERYYRIMYYGGAECWNLRDTHMSRHWSTSSRPWARNQGVVWAHNSHIGDARYTEMGASRRAQHRSTLPERFGRGAALIGFGTHTGTVAAASEWDGEMEIKRCGRLTATATSGNATKPASPAFCWILWSRRSCPAAAARTRLERFIGVIYRPETEL